MSRKDEVMANRVGNTSTEKVKVRVRGKVTHGRVKETVVYERERLKLHVIILSDGSQFIARERYY